ncbi:SPJ_0845 family protein [uncultured Enterococcus sp.]|nr:SPJ_0845 family protein [uncultured Enterococcus sp.]
MGLKFESSDDLDKLFESFAIDPKDKEKPKKEKDTNEPKNKEIKK